MLPELVRQLFWPSWKEDVESDMIMQVSDVCQKFMNKQREYLDNRRCLRGNLLNFIFIRIFGSYVWVCRMTRSVRNALQLEQRVKVIHYLLNEEERHLLKHRHLVPMWWSGFDWRSLKSSGLFSWYWLSCTFCQQPHQQGLVHYSR